MGKKKRAKADTASAEPEIHNRKARHLYHIDDTLECGVKLIGSEVKSVRAGRISIGEGYVLATEEPPRLELHGVHIDEYAPAGPNSSYRPTQSRALLAHKREIRKLARRASEKGVTIVPLKVYFKNGFVKVLVGVGTGKRQYDKRQDIKRRDVDRDLRRAMSKRV
jgi:SsrA-binding protein